MSLHIIITALLVPLWRIDTGLLLAGPSISHERNECKGNKAIAIESALPYGLISLILMILYCTSTPAANLFVPLLVQLQGTTSDLIIMRIAAGQAWSFDTVRAIHEKIPQLRGQLKHLDNVAVPQEVMMAVVRDGPKRYPDKKIVYEDVV